MNIAEILLKNNIPQGYKLYSPIFGEVEFDEIAGTLSDNPIIWIKTSNGVKPFTKNGNMYISGVYSNYSPECMLFPSSEQRSWETWSVSLKFKPGDWVIKVDGGTFSDGSPIVQVSSVGTDGRIWLTIGTYMPYEKIRRWTINDAKDGDIIAFNDEKSPWIGIFKGRNRKPTFNYDFYCIVTDEGEFDPEDCWAVCESSARLATPVQCELLFTAMKNANYEWDFESKELRKITPHKFKVNDWIVSLDSWKRVYQVTSVEKTCYYYDHTSKYDLIDVADGNYRLWDIRDAQDGQILTCENGWTCIFKKFESIGDTFSSYCFIDSDGKFHDGMAGHCPFGMVPATASQAKQFFKNLKRKGYAWDPCHKTLISIETKFKIGQWITNGVYTYCITSIDDTYYYFNGGRFKIAINLVNENYHVWTPSDAKDGDFLVSSNGCIFIYDKTREKDSDKGYYYACIDAYNTIQIKVSNTSGYYCGYLQESHPATDVEIDNFLNRLESSYYEWNFEKKEILKISHYDISNFCPGMEVLVRDSDNEDWHLCIFSHYDSSKTVYPFRTDDYWKQCIPFKGNEALVGTSNMCSEEFINWPV